MGENPFHRFRRGACRLVLQIAVLCLLVGSTGAVAQPAIVPEEGHKFLDEAEGAKAIVEDIAKIGLADQQLAAAMFLKILAEKSPTIRPFTQHPPLIGKPQTFPRRTIETTRDHPEFDDPRMVRQAAARTVLCAVLRGDIAGFGKCAPEPASSRVTHTSTGPAVDKWRIDEPVVNSPVTEYPTIPLAAGDKVTTSAGGCVQTGIFGPSWKRLVDPEGPGSDRLYHGTIQLRGAPNFAQPARIADWIGRTVTMPAGTPATVLVLGYEHDHYWNAGYYGRDDGTQDQCKNLGPAWVEIEVEHR